MLSPGGRCGPELNENGNRLKDLKAEQAKQLYKGGGGGTGYGADRGKKKLNRHSER